MTRYIQQLLGDLEDAISSASQLPEQEWYPPFEDEAEDLQMTALQAVKLERIYHIPAEAFPPENLLDEAQIIELLDSIQRLWSSWRICWELPHELSARKSYHALRHAMLHETVTWDATMGGHLTICRFEEKGFCPFGENGGYCYCRELDASVKHDIAIWEEHVRSQGLDPYRELSEEETAAFEEEMRIRNERKLYGEDWLKMGYSEFSAEYESEDEETLELELEEDSDEWLERIFWEGNDLDHSSDATENDLDKGHDSNNLMDDFDDDEDIDLPLF